jgi:hypothetical protein
MDEPPQRIPDAETPRPATDTAAGATNGAVVTGTATVTSGAAVIGSAGSGSATATDGSAVGVPADNGTAVAAGDPGSPTNESEPTTGRRELERTATSRL